MASKESIKPLYQTIVDRLSRELASGRYKPGQKFPSEAALVKKFNVSRITVTRAVRELQQRGLVDRVAGSGTYVRSPVQRPRENLLFGLIIPNLGDTEIFEPICQGIAASPDASGHGLLWGHADSRAASKEEQALQLCHQCIARGVSGVFFAPLELSEGSAEVNRRTMKLLKKAGIPVVLLDRRPEEMAEEASIRERCDLVGIDNHRAGFLATEHLLRLGARRLGFIGYQNQASTVKARIRGFKDALSNSTHEATGATGAIGKRFVVRPAERLELPSAAYDCDAFVCANDRVAGQLMHALLAQGVSIPRDVRLVGIDDAGYADLLPVPLTTVHQPCRDLGEAALRVMLERLDRPQMPARDILLDCQLVIRRSCGARDGSSVKFDVSPV
jgi:GntR family transcriptional regulator, arabinose operon transcriptional repressor